MLTHETRILIIGHLPSEDNLRLYRSRDQEIDAGSLEIWHNNCARGLPLTHAMAQLIDATYCPTTVRHHQTAKLITEAFGIDAPVPDARINNIDYGVFKGRPLEETPHPTEALEFPYDGGESWQSVAERWNAFFRTTVRNFPNSVILLAGQSANAVRMLKHICLHQTLEEVLTSPVPHLQFFSVGAEVQDFSSVIWKYRWQD